MQKKRGLVGRQSPIDTSGIDPERKAYLLSLKPHEQALIAGRENPAYTKAEREWMLKNMSAKAVDILAGWLM